jgi:hypothetical protein
MTNKAPITWIAHYLDACETKTVIRKINAEMCHDAYFFASKLSPAARFVLNVSAKSNEQVFGSVRYGVDRRKKDG